MAGPAAATATTHQSSVPRYGPALALLTTLFFMWGFISAINGTLLPHLRSVFQLNYFQTTLTEWIWFVGYLVASIPAAFLIEDLMGGHAPPQPLASGSFTAVYKGMLL